MYLQQFHSASFEGIAHIHFTWHFPPGVLPEELGGAVRPATQTFCAIYAFFPTQKPDQIYHTQVMPIVADIVALSIILKGFCLWSYQ